MRTFQRSSCKRSVFCLFFFGGKGGGVSVLLSSSQVSLEETYFPCDQSVADLLGILAEKAKIYVNLEELNKKNIHG